MLGVYSSVCPKISERFFADIRLRCSWLETLENKANRVSTNWAVIEFGGLVFTDGDGSPGT